MDDAIDSIVKLERATHKGSKRTKIILIDLSKVPGCVSRRTLRIAINKARLPITKIKNITQGRHGAKLRLNDAGTYGAMGYTTLGVFQGHHSALLFSIYLDYAMQDLQCRNAQMQLHRRYNIQRRVGIHTQKSPKSTARPDSMDKGNAETPQDHQAHDLSEHEEQSRGRSNLRR